MNQIKRVWIPADSFYAEEESCSTRDVQVVLASDYDRHVADLTAKLKLQAMREQYRTLVEFYDKHNGTPCEQIRHQQEVEDLTQRLEEAQADNLQWREHVAQLRTDLAQARGKLVAYDRAVANDPLLYARASVADLQTKLAAVERERDVLRTALLALPVAEGEIFIEKVFTCNHWEVRLRGEGSSIGLGYFYWEDHANHYAALLRLAQAMR